MFAFLVWLTALTILSHGPLPGPGVPSPIPHFDKVVHFVYFAAGATVLSWWLILRYPHLNRRQRVLRLWPLFLVIGALDEFHQSFFPERSGNDLGDWIADGLGSLFGILIAANTYRLLRKLASPVKLA